MRHGTFDDDFLDDLRRFKPRLNNPEAIKQGVLKEIEKDECEETLNRRKSIYFMRLTASVLILITIGNYAWQEVNMYYSRIQLYERLSIDQDKNYENYECRQALHALILDLEESTLGQFYDGRTIIITVQQFLFLQENDSPFLPDVKNFLAALKKLYPEKYEQFNQEGVLRLSIWQLKHDYRFCQWLN